jgi:biotin synthase-related radical SAM superfamily protein
MIYSKNDSVGTRIPVSVYRRFNYPVFRIIGNELSGLNLMMFSASLGIIHQIRIVQTDFFDKPQIIPSQ